MMMMVEAKAEIGTLTPQSESSIPKTNTKRKTHNMYHFHPFGDYKSIMKISIGFGYTHLTLHTNALL
jgi:hypothetical protein